MVVAHTHTHTHTHTLTHSCYRFRYIGRAGSLWPHITIEHCCEWSNHVRWNCWIKLRKKSCTCMCVRVPVSEEYKSRALLFSHNSTRLGFGIPLPCTVKPCVCVQQNCKQPTLCVNHRWFIRLQQEVPFISPVELRLTPFAASSCRVHNLSFSFT